MRMVRQLRAIKDQQDRAYRELSVSRCKSAVTAERREFRLRMLRQSKRSLPRLQGTSLFLRKYRR